MNVLPRVAGNDRGQAMIEMALLLPLLVLLAYGIVQGGILFNNWIVLTEATRSGARELSLGRAPSVNACDNATTRLKSAAFNLHQADLVVTYTVANSCTDLAVGSAATLRATYPCALRILGINFAPGCTLRSEVTERVE
jgi:Flp pilus assembly protein TadG